MTIRLKSEEIRFASKLNLDTSGRVFFWENSVYRAISPKMAPIYQELLQSDHAQRLFDLGLVETEIAPIKLDGYDLVLKHRTVPFVSYVTEWCGAMLKDAALLTLDLNLALAKSGLGIKDAHPWNILFDGSKPRFVDFGSIIPMQPTDDWRPLQQFIGYFYNPLRLMSVGCGDRARSLIVDSRKRLSRRVRGRDVLLALLRERKLRQFLDMLWQPSLYLGNGNKTPLVHLRDRISALSIQLERTSWSEYSFGEVDLSIRDSWKIKRKSFFDIISDIRPKTLLDIGSNTGWYSKLAAMQGSSVVAFDRDETCINKLYLNPEARKHSILPLVADFSRNKQPYGRVLSRTPLNERIRCDMLLGLAIVHHLVFKQNMGFDAIIKNLAAFAKKWLLVEFIPREDKYVSVWYDDRFAWYTVDGFVKELRQHFRKIEPFPSTPEHRILFLCEK